MKNSYTYSSKKINKCKKIYPIKKIKFSNNYFTDDVYSKTDLLTTDNEHKINQYRINKYKINKANKANKVNKVNKVNNKKNNNNNEKNNNDIVNTKILNEIYNVLNV